MGTPRKAFGKNLVKERKGKQPLKPQVCAAIIAQVLEG
jgi:hypothetical protein